MSGGKRTYGTGSVYRRGEIWWIKYRVDGQVRRESSESTDRKVADRLLLARLSDAAHGRALSCDTATVNDLLDLVLEDYEAAGKRSLQITRWRADKHLRPAIGRMKASKLSDDDVARYVKARYKAKAAVATVNRELALLARAYAIAMRRRPPLAVSAPRIVKARELNEREGFVSPEQYQSILKALPAHLKTLFVVGYHTGCRVGELRKLTWSQVDLFAGEIRIRRAHAKSDRPRTVPIYGDMGKWLKRQWKEHESTWPNVELVFHYLGKPIGSHMKGWSTACEAAGLPELLFHDLRRSAVRNMVRAGIPESIAMAISGHQTRSVFQRYNIISGDDIATAGRQIASYLDTARRKIGHKIGHTDSAPIPIRKAK